MIDPESLEEANKHPPSVYDQVCLKWIMLREWYYSVVKKLGEKL